MAARLAHNRERIGIALGVGLGLVLAFIDSRPGFDDTGITAVLLVAAALTSVLVAGPALALAGSPILATAAWTALVGLWIVIVERSTGSVLALVFAAIGAGAAVLFLRWRHANVDRVDGRDGGFTVR
jgi:hypothetical protein